MTKQTIILKNTNIAGKVPTPSQLETAELVIQLKDKKLFSKDVDGTVFEFPNSLPGEVPSGNTIDRPSSPTEGDLYYDLEVNGLLYWNGTSWEQVGAEGDAKYVKLNNGGTDQEILGDGSLLLNGALICNDGANFSNGAVSESTKDTDIDTELTTKDYVDRHDSEVQALIPTNTSDLTNDSGFITDAGVTKIIAGSNITIDPVDGTGDVTINAADAPDAPVTSVNGETGDVVLDLKDINDVTITAINNGDFITWNGTAWINTTAPPADISGSSIGDLNDVDTTGVDNGDILVWDNVSGKWKPEAPSTPDGLYVKLDDEGTEQSIVGGGGIDILGGITSEFGTNSAQLGNIAPLNNWSVYPSRV